MICPSGPSRPLRRTNKEQHNRRIAKRVLLCSALSSLLLSFASTGVQGAVLSRQQQSSNSFQGTGLTLQRQRSAKGRSVRGSKDSNVDFFQLANLEAVDNAVDASLRFSEEEESSSSYSLNDLVGKQTHDGYVFARRAGLLSVLSVPRTAVVTFLSRRDLHISRPPMVPNSNSRLLIGLVLVCIFALGILTFLMQHIWSRVWSSLSPVNSTQARNGERRSSRPAQRSDSHIIPPLSYTDVGIISSLEEEEEGIRTPPALLRRSSSALSAQATDEGANDFTAGSGRKSPHDLHYFSLPFGLGIGFSYGQLSDRHAAEARINTLNTGKGSSGKRERSSSDLVTSTSALPTLSTNGMPGGDGLRSRARSFKEMCKDAMHTAVSSETLLLKHEADDTLTASRSRWLPSIVAYNASGSDSCSGSTKPTSHANSVLRSSVSDIALDELPATISAGSKGKARRFAADEVPHVSHTLVDVGQAESSVEALLSDPQEITRPASSPAAPLPSQIPRHPQVEQLRRQGRTETGKRVGKGTPTNAKVF